MISKQEMASEMKQTNVTSTTWEALLSPKSVAIFGASDDPNKIGGRPIAYMQRFGFEGSIVPINPNRLSVQGLKAYRSLSDYDGTVDVGIVAVGGRRAVDAVKQAADAGIRACVVIASGFGEGGDAAGAEMLDEMLDYARTAGMRLVGPNSQGIASFDTNAVLSFSTLFSEFRPKDGPIAIVSQSGAMASVPYAMLRERGFGVRYVHATGNDADIGLSDLAMSAVSDPEISVLVLYIENLSDADGLRSVAQLARDHDTAILALYGGISPVGQQAAASHTGALATEELAVRAFFNRIGIGLANSLEQIVDTIPIWLSGKVPTSNRVIGVSSSGASCVAISDAAYLNGLNVAEFSAETRSLLEARLPKYASSENPTDLTAALLTDAAILGDSLEIISENEEYDVLVVALPVTGDGYDIARFASDTARISSSYRRLVVGVVNNPRTRDLFEQAGIVVFEDVDRAIAAVSSVITQVRLRRKAGPSLSRCSEALDSDHCESANDIVLVNEHQSQSIIESAGVEFAERYFVPLLDFDTETFSLDFDAEEVVVKGVTTDTSHKSEFGIVQFCKGSSGAVSAAIETIRRSADESSLRLDGFLICKRLQADAEFIIGARYDSRLGVIGIAGFGGKFAELDPDTVTLIEPFTNEYVLDRLMSLRGSRIFEGFRDLPAVDISKLVESVVGLCSFVASENGLVLDAEVNPLIYSSARAVGVDAVIHRRLDSQGARAEESVS